MKITGTEIANGKWNGVRNVNWDGGVGCPCWYGLCICSGFVFRFHLATDVPGLVSYPGKDYLNYVCSAALWEMAKNIHFCIDLLTYSKVNYIYNCISRSM